MKYLILTIGIVIGILLPFTLDWILFGDPTPVNIVKEYEDGSFIGCMAGGLCND